MNADHPVLNLESVRIAFEDDDAGLLDLLDLVLATAQTDLANLAAAIGARDATLVGKLAHGLKGASSNVGAEEFAAIAARLETAVHEGAWDRGVALFEQLEGAFGRVRTSIEAFRASVK